MLTCIARSKQPSHQPENSTPNMISSQIKDMAMKACAPCATADHRKNGAGETGSAPAVDKFRWSYRRTRSTSSTSSSTAGRKELQARLRGISSGEGNPAATSGQRVDSVVFVEEREPKEWVAQVESGVLITFVSLPRGGNDLKKIKFSRELFDKWQAQTWWAENCEKVMELYNVQGLNRQAFPLPSTPKSEENVVTKMKSIEASPVAPPLGRPNGMGVGYSSSESFDHHSSGVASTSKPSSMSGAKTEVSSLDASMRTSSSTQDADRSGEMSINNVGYLESEWVEEDEPGVYLTIRALPSGRRELRRVRFSREKYGEMHARVWWEEHRERIQKQYL